MPTLRISPVEAAEQLAKAMEDALDDGSIDHEVIQTWAREVRELGIIVANQRRTLFSAYRRRSSMNEGSAVEH